MNNKINIGKVPCNCCDGIMNLNRTRAIGRFRLWYFKCSKCEAYYFKKGKISEALSSWSQLTSFCNNQIIFVLKEMAIKE
jgi:hypothetical protein